MRTIWNLDHQIEDEKKWQIEINEMSIANPSLQQTAALLQTLTLSKFDWKECFADMFHTWIMDAGDIMQFSSFHVHLINRKTHLYVVL